MLLLLGNDGSEFSILHVIVGCLDSPTRFLSAKRRRKRVFARIALSHTHAPLYCRLRLNSAHPAHTALAETGTTTTTTTTKSSNTPVRSPLSIQLPGVQQQRQQSNAYRRYAPHCLLQHTRITPLTPFPAHMLRPGEASSLLLAG